jgi:hypothetical protein
MSVMLEGRRRVTVGNAIDDLLRLRESSRKDNSALSSVPL